VHDPFAVRVGERLEDLPRDVERVLDRERPPLLQVGPEVRAFDELHDEVRRLALGVEPERPDDVRMLEAPLELTLGAELVDVGPVGRQLDRDEVVQDVMSRLPDLAEAAFAELLDEHVLADPLTGAGHDALLPSSRSKAPAETGAPCTR
jgi:hypothetical protein